MRKTKLPVPSHTDRIKNQIRNFVARGQYKKGVDLVEKVLKSQPDDFYFKYQYAK